MPSPRRISPLAALGSFLALSLLLAGCGPTATPTAAATSKPQATNTTAPTAEVITYKQAPILDAQVNSGDLPPVVERLPENPLVEEAESIGTYGGTWRRGFLGPSDYNNYIRIVADSLLVFSPDGTKVLPKIAESYESSADFTTWTLYLRKGGKWSDGSSFTADDIMFWYEDILQNKDLMPSIPSWMKNSDGSTVKVTKVDDYTVTWTYLGANTTWPLEMANKDNGDRAYPAFLPAAYMKQFHAKYADAAALEKMVGDAGFKTWTELFAMKKNQAENPDRPGTAAWIPTTAVGKEVMVMKRNPYYMGVDTEGNQLPYIDEVRMIYFADAASLNVAAIAGEFDEQERQINLMNYPVFKEEELKGKYKVYTWASFGGGDADISFNQTYIKDTDLGALMQNKDFRIAMSYAIDRGAIKESAFMGLGEARQPVPAPNHPFYPGDEYAYKFTEYDTAKANELLDGIGLDKKNADGIRLYPGTNKPVQIEISVVPAFGPWPDVAQLIAADWNKVGVQAIVQVRERALHFQMRSSNDLQTEIWNQDTTGFPFTGNPKLDPRTMLAGGITVWPLFNTWYNTGGTDGLEPSADAKKIVELIDKARTVGGAEQAAVAQELFKLWVDNCYEIGTIGLTPMVQGVVVVSNNMMNVPTALGNDWPLRTPGNGMPETWYFKA
jgi:peptide/nickel transport system substrate-binding protein